MSNSLSAGDKVLIDAVVVDDWDKSTDPRVRLGGDQITYVHRSAIHKEQDSKARNDALEEAAQVADLFHQRGFDGVEYINPVRDDIARAIRSLIRK